MPVRFDFGPIHKGTVEINTLIDCGATDSFISRRALSSNILAYLDNFIETPGNPNNIGVKRMSIQINAATGSPCRTQCVSIWLNITIDDCWSGAHRFIVTDAINTEHAILGNDFLMQHEWTIRQGVFNIIDNKAAPAVCQLSEDVTISANSESFLCVTSANAHVNRVVVFEPFDHSGQSLVAAKSLNRVNKDNELAVRIMNYSDKPVTLKRNQVIGVVDEPAAVRSNNSQGNKPHQADQRLSIVRNAVTKKLADNSCITKAERDQVASLLHKFSDVISLNDNDLGKTSLVAHSINTGDHPPIKCMPYRTPFKRREIIDKEIARMQELDVIEECDGPWAFPIVLVQKKDGAVRFCVDYRKLNKITRLDSYPLPRIEDCVDALASSTRFSTLDLASGYWQVEVDKDSRDKTAFCTPNGLYRFKVMPFGLSNAPATFQRLMDKVLRGLTWRQCIVYIDDIIVFGATAQQHLQRLESVLARLRQANLRIKLSKCRFSQPQVDFLGFCVDAEGIRPTECKIEALVSIERPRSITEVRSFVGAVAYYRRSIPNFADISQPLNEMTGKNARFKWDAKCQHAFNQLKMAVSNAPVLVYPNYNQPFRMTCDASDYAISGVLSQLDA